MISLHKKHLSLLKKNFGFGIEQLEFQTEEEFMQLFVKKYIPQRNKLPSGVFFFFFFFFLCVCVEEIGGQCYVKAINILKREKQLMR